MNKSMVLATPTMNFSLEVFLVLLNTIYFENIQKKILCNLLQDKKIDFWGIILRVYFRLID